MPETVTTNISSFEVEIEFVEPNIRVWLDRVVVVEAIYAALRPWDITVDDIEVINIGKPSEQGVNFKVPSKRASFFFGAGGCRFNRASTNWETAGETIQVLDAALSAFLENSATKLKMFSTSVSLHVQPANKPFFEILAPLIPQPMAALDPESAEAMAVIVKWPRHRVTIDGSSQIANGMFIRYERQFPADCKFETMAKQLYADEAQIFAMLDIAEK